MIKQESVENKGITRCSLTKEEARILENRRSEGTKIGWETRRRNLEIFQKNREAEARRQAEQDDQTRER